ncbi:CamS family sex pheromone protein [Bacillus taeanensis]|nr:CamS family sex pheromone protein [Bacillus taeanensis]
MLKRLGITALTSMVLLSGCLSNKDNEETVVKEEESKQKVIISREINTSERFYRSVLPFEPSAARGLIEAGVDNRLDIDELETGLMRIAQETFDPDNYFLKEGQFLTKEEVQSWIDRSSPKNQEGLNQAISGDFDSLSADQKLTAEENNPKYLSYVLEHNYLVQKEEGKVQLGGIVIALSMNNSYYYRVEDDQGRFLFGDTKLDKQKIEEEAKKMGQEVANRLRKKEELRDVPIVIALYQEAERESIIPGYFFASTVVNKGQSTIKGWDEINEQYYFFPSNQALEDHRDDAEKFNNFKARVEEFFPNYVGVIGKGFYKKGELQSLTIDIPMQFYGKAEVVAFTQYVTDLIDKNFFQKGASIEVNITSMNQQESLIVKDPDKEEPYVHIYH